ncbi:MAG: hypothetical protein GF313_07100 [Caldithrix sp.]|nr:hypothetical protein [Caldithrix sp.]
MDLKHLSYLFVINGLFLFLYNESCAQSIEQLFEKGNIQYQEGQYTQALEYYQKISERGYESGPLYFNMGNCYYKLNDLGHARLYYERARFFMKGDMALKENIRLLELRLDDKIEPPPKFFLFTWWEALINMFSIQILSWVVALGFWIVLVLAALWLYFQQRRGMDRFKNMFVIMTVFFMIASFILVYKIYERHDTVRGVIMQPVVTVYSAPDSESTEVFVLHEGTVFRVERRNDDWLEIKLLDGKSGWLKNTTVSII